MRPFVNGTVTTNDGSLTLSVLNMPNPYNPMSWVHAAIAEQLISFDYVVVACLGAMVFDLVQAAPEDFRIVFLLPLSVHTLVYVLARLSTLWCFLYTILSITQESPDCAAWIAVGSSSYVIAHAFNSLLFFFRVRAVYPNNRHIFFITLATWFGLVGASSTTLLAFHGKWIEPTRYCLYSGRGNYVLVGPVIQALYDFLVCGLITWKVAIHHQLPQKDNPRGRGWKTWFVYSKKRVAFFAYRFLQDSQIYLTLSVILKTFVVISFLILLGVYPNRAGSWVNNSIIPAYIDLFLIHVLSSRIYRNMRLRKPGVLQASTTRESAVSNIVFEESGGSIPLSKLPTHSFTA